MKKTKIIGKLVALILTLVITMTCAIPALTASITIDNATHDYTSIDSLSYEYSYGTLVWTDGVTSLENIQVHEKYTLVTEGGTYRFGGEEGDILKFRINKCSVDADGDLCDVLVTIDNIERMTSYTPASGNILGETYFGENLSDPIRCVMECNFKAEKFGDLILFNFNTIGASATFSMTYYKTGTNKTANIDYNVSSFYDIDVDTETPEQFSSEYFDGNEGMAVKNSTVYYDKSADGYLQNNADHPSEFDVGVAIRSHTTITNEDGIEYNPSEPEKTTSCVMIQELENATYEMFYSGRACGMFWLFISPYTFDIPAPTIDVSKSRVYEGETFNYYINQYVPNNYYADELDFIEGVGGKYTSFVISDQLDEDLVVNGDITISNEGGTNVTEYFDIAVQNNLMIATLKTAYLSNIDFYTHLYTINIPVYIKEETGASKEIIENQASTFARNNLTSETQNTLVVDVALKYDVDITGSIDHGSIYIDDGTASSTAYKSTSVDHGNSNTNTVYFTVADEYNLVGVTVDNQAIEPSDLSQSNGVYSYTITDTNITSDVSHNVTVTTAVKDAQVIVKHIDESGKSLCEDETINGKVFADYTTSPKTFYGYSSTETPSNSAGQMTLTPITVTYVYALKDAKVNVLYVDEEGDRLADPESITGKVFDDYATSAKEIYGWRLTSTPANATGTMTEEDITVTYVYTQKQASVTANYVDEDGAQIDTSVITSGNVGDSYATSAKEIYGYELTENPSNMTGVYTESDIVVNYVYRLKDASVVVSYETADGTKLTDNLSIPGKVFDTYNTESKTFYGYELSSLPNNASGTMTESIIYVKYVYNLKDTSVLVNYVDTVGESIADSDTISGKVFDKYTTSAKTIYGYELTAAPSNFEGEMTEEQIVVNYVYRLKDSSVVVNYIDANGTPIAEGDTINGKVFDPYETAAKTIYGYQLTETPSNATGTLTEEQIIVNYVYDLKSASVTARYIDTDGNTLADDIVLNGNVFDAYETTALSFEEYNLTEIPSNSTGTMTEETITVIYVYALKPASVTVHYLDENGNELDDSVILTGSVRDPYQATAKDFYGYSLTKTPDNATGNMTVDPITVNFVYALKPAVVSVRYLGKNNQPIADELTINGKVFDEYTTSPKTIYGYELVSHTDNVSGQMTEEEIKVVYSYRLKTASVNVNYINESGDPLADSNTISGQVFDSYETEPLEIYGYDLVLVPNNANGTMTEEPITVNYVYTIKNSSVTVHYVTEDGEPLTEDVIFQGKVFDPYAAENKEFYGYELTAIPENMTGTMTEDPIDVNFVFRLKNAQIRVQYLTDDGTVLEQEQVLNGKVFDEYDTEALDFYGYALTEMPENASGTMTEEEILVTYVYALRPAQVTAHYIDENGNEIAESEILSGKVFDPYETQAKEIYGYELVTIPENASGEMSESPIDVYFNYVLKDAVVTAVYVDKDGASLANDETVNGKVFDAYKTEPKDIYGYRLIETPENQEGTMTEEPITVTYTYELKPAEVIVQFVDKDGNPLADKQLISGLVFDAYETEAEEINGYTLSVTPDNAEGTMTEEPITVTYVYEAVPEPEIPYTGNSGIYGYLTIAGAAVALIGVVLLVVRKKKSV